MSARELIVPDNWTGGEIWGRRDCDFNKPKGKDDKDCAIGTCRGGLECKGSSVSLITCPSSYDQG